MAEQNVLRQEMHWEANMPIQMLCICSTKGIFTPRWFRYEDEGHGIHCVQIENILSSREIQYVGVRMIQYICTAQIGNRRRSFELRYNVISHKWVFYRMLD